MPSKYRNRRTKLDGEIFDSIAEARRWSELRLLERAGVIADLRRQARFPLEMNGTPICTYVADFTYREVATGKAIVEDVKGMRTQVYRLKAKMMAASGHPITEVRA